MPANPPANTPEDVQPRPEPTGAAVLADDQLDEPPGGGPGGNAAPGRGDQGATPAEKNSP
jgi:hypothetical protein